MTQAYWPTSLPLYLPIQSYSGGPQDARASFKPEFGPPIERLRSTGAPEVYSVVAPGMSAAEYTAFKTWFEDTLSRGVNNFVWRDQLQQDAARFRILAEGGIGYRVEGESVERRQIGFQVMRLPGSPWFIGYVAAGTAVPPVCVIDFANDVYGTDSGTPTLTTKSALITEGGTPTDDSSGLTLGGGDSATLTMGAWETASGTWVVDLSGVSGSALFNGFGSSIGVSGTGKLVVAYDGSEGLVYASGAYNSDAGAWTSPATIEPLDGTGTIVSAVLYPEKLTAARCAALATGSLSIT